MSSSIASHIRTNVVGYTALFVALSGTVYAADKVGSKDIRTGAVKSKQIGDDNVKSKDLKDGKAVKSRDVKDGTLTEADVAGGSLTGESIEDDSLTAADIDESTLPSSGSPSGPAGGDLSGSYPDPQIASSAVGSNKVADDSLTGADIDEDTLGTVPNASLLNGTSASGFLQPGSGAGGDLTGTYPNPLIGSNKVDSANVVDNSLTGSDVNEGTLGKVPDADKLDGIDSASLLRGESVKGQISVGGPNLTRSYAPLAGVGEVVVTCDTATSPPLAKVRYKNTANGAYGVYIDDSGSGVSKATPNPDSETSILSTSTTPRHVVYRTFTSTVGKAAEWDVFVSTSTSFCFVSVVRTND